MNIIFIIGAFALGIQVILYLLMVLGLPLAPLTLNGEYKILPKEFRSAFLASAIFQSLILLTLLQTSGILNLPIPGIITRIFAVLFALFLTFNAIKILASGAPLEKKVILPLTSITAISFFVAFATVPVNI